MAERFDAYDVMAVVFVGFISGEAASVFVWRLRGSCAGPVPPPVPGRVVPTEAGHEFMFRDERESA